jgi:hypothetical protein
MSPGDNRESGEAFEPETRDLHEQIRQLEADLDLSEANADRHLGLATKASVIGAIAVLGAIVAALLA